MKTDGPTLDEMSNLDTTGNLEQDTTYREPVRRPVSTKKRVKNWFEDYTKEIIISIVSAIILLVAGSLVLYHNIQLTEHGKDIEYLQSNDQKQDGAIEKLQEKSNEINTEVKLIEQRVDFESEKSRNLQEKTGKKGRQFKYFCVFCFFCVTKQVMTMTTDELILKAIEKCLEQASDPEQKRLFHWMKAAIQYPSIEAFFNEVQAAGSNPPYERKVISI